MVLKNVTLLCSINWSVSIDADKLLKGFYVNGLR